MKDDLSITEMAALHQISRQTLIYYDRIGLFSPDHIEANGYRCYSVAQIPFLREICFLKSMGIRLEDIKRHIHDRDPHSELALLAGHACAIGAEIERLTCIQACIRQRIGQYQRIAAAQLEQPVVCLLPARTVVFQPWEGSPDRRTLHLCIMKLWGILAAQEIAPSQRFGSILRSGAGGELLCGAGCYIELPEDCSPPVQALVLPAGTYACMQKYGMPYETAHLEELLRWIRENGWTPCGDWVDACLLDATFYRTEGAADLCELQIPVQKKPLTV